MASNRSPDISGLGVLAAHLTPGLPITVVSSIKNGMPRGIFDEK